MDRRTKVSDASAPKRLQRVEHGCGSELDCRPLFRPLAPEVAGSSIWFGMSGKENAFRQLFFSPDDDEEFRGGRGNV